MSADPELELEKILLEKERARQKTAEAELAKLKVRYEHLFSQETLAAFVFSVLLVCVAGVSCFGCYTTYQLDYVLAEHGMKRAEILDNGVRRSVIVPLEHGR